MLINLTGPVRKLMSHTHTLMGKKKRRNRGVGSLRFRNSTSRCTTLSSLEESIAVSFASTAIYQVSTMAKKKKKKSLKRREMQEEAKEELEVLAAIFGDHFVLDEDAHGFTLQVVPHPGRTEPNYVSVQLAARYLSDHFCADLRVYTAKTHAACHLHALLCISGPASFGDQIYVRRRC